MKRIKISPALMIIAFSLCINSCAPRNQDSTENSAPKRIISLAPSITETLFALGAGDRVVGVTSYCAYPEDAKLKEQLGGYTNPSFEKILSLRPDMVIILNEHEAIKQFCRTQGLRCLSIDNHDLGLILQSIDTLGKLCAAEKAADSILSAIRLELSSGLGKSAEKARPSILFCIDRSEPGSGRIATVYIAGPKTFYSEILKAAGARNAYADSSAAYPVLSLEGIVSVKPDIIIDVTMNPKISREKLERDWQSLSYISAVKNGMLFCVDESYMTIPGPRIILLIRKIKEILNAYRQNG